MPSKGANVKAIFIPTKKDLPFHLFHFSLRSRCTAMLAGLRT
jgi:hypothetical protein